MSHMSSSARQSDLTSREESALMDSFAPQDLSVSVKTRSAAKRAVEEALRTARLLHESMAYFASPTPSWEASREMSREVLSLIDGADARLRARGAEREAIDRITAFVEPHLFSGKVFAKFVDALRTFDTACRVVIGHGGVCALFTDRRVDERDLSDALLQLRAAKVDFLLSRVALLLEGAEDNCALVSRMLETADDLNASLHSDRLLRRLMESFAHALDTCLEKVDPNDKVMRDWQLVFLRDTDSRRIVADKLDAFQELLRHSELIHWRRMRKHLSERDLLEKEKALVERDSRARSYMRKPTKERTSLVLEDAERNAEQRASLLEKERSLREQEIIVKRQMAVIHHERRKVEREKIRLLERKQGEVQQREHVAKERRRHEREQEIARERRDESKEQQLQRRMDADFALTQTIPGRFGPVGAVALAGGCLAAASGSRVRVFRRRSAQSSFEEVQTLVGHSDAVYCVALSKDASVLVSGGGDKRAIVWQRRSDGAYERAQGLSGHQGDVLGVAVYTEGTAEEARRALRSISRSRTVDARRANSDAMGGGGGEAASIIVTGSADMSAKVWERQSGGGFALLQTLRGHKNSVSCVAMNSGLVCTGSWDQTVKVWESSPETGRFEPFQELRGHKDDVTALQVCGWSILSASVDQTARLYRRMDNGRFAPLQVFSGHTHTISAVALTSRFAVTAGCDCVMNVYAVDGKRGGALEGKQVIEAHRDWIRAVAVDGFTIVSGSEDDAVKVFDVPT